MTLAGLKLAISDFVLRLSSHLINRTILRRSRIWKNGPGFSRPLLRSGSALEYKSRGPGLVSYSGHFHSHKSSWLTGRAVSKAWGPYQSHKLKYHSLIGETSNCYTGPVMVCKGGKNYLQIGSFNVVEYTANLILVSSVEISELIGILFLITEKTITLSYYREHCSFQ